ncbi:pyridine nucleotide-disulfide oxidoreductase-domain-containing protein [Rhodocollybia butyracea]|uniref:Pyridine nucleotide-disulfide oxidoreductase-domain-containing protein n=1 Tax=Rhodocollybia butyracea TaxID=206335 RepID=A0A9P5UGG2_9AGAR|nr:pyridine nucleotide-disulfide oxidoreductase-domain-containing protein [Rhodocollybia butyracea]
MTRCFQRPGARAFSSTSRREKQRLAILGSGWGGYELLRRVDKKRWDVVLVSPNTYFNFTPLLASCAVGTLEFRCAIEPVRRYSPESEFYQAWCDGIDFQNKILHCTPATKPAQVASPSDVSALANFTVKYDKLVIAVGAYSQTFNIPGVKEHAHFLKDVRDARAIRNRILECLEQANQPTLSDTERRRLLNFVCVGAGPTGVEFTAELHDLIHAELSKHYPSLAKMARINLYDVAPSILGMFDRNLVQYTEKNFRRDGISIYTSHHVDRVEAGKIYIQEQGEVPYGLLVWSTGLAPNPLIASINELKKHERKQSIVTDNHLNALNPDGSPNPDVYVIGDAACIENVPLPATAQVANQQAKYLYKKLNKIIRDRPHDKPFEFHNQGSLAYVGDWKAIYDKPENGGVPGLNKENGRLAWLLWRSAYFTQTLSIRNKILVPFYWFLNWIFGRDLTRF